MSCNTFLDQCSCQNSLIDLIAPSTGTFEVAIYSRFNNKKRLYQQDILSGENFVLPVELNPFAIYELTLKLAGATVEISDQTKWYLQTMVCEDNETGTISTNASFEYVLEDQTGLTIDLDGAVIETASGDVTLAFPLSAAIYKVIVYKNGSRLVLDNQYSYNTTTGRFTFVNALDGDQIIFDFQYLGNITSIPITLVLPNIYEYVNQSVTGLTLSLDGVTASNETESIVLDFPLTNYRFDIFKNGSLITDGVEYTLNYNTGLLTFTVAMDSDKLIVRITQI